MKFLVEGTMYLGQGVKGFSQLALCQHLHLWAMVQASTKLDQQKGKRGVIGREG